MGNRTFMRNIYMAPIQDDMLLGLDFPLKRQVDIKLKGLHLHIRAADDWFGLISVLRPVDTF